MWLLWLTIGVVFGSIVTNIIMYIRTGYGVLRIDRSNPDKDKYRFEVGGSFFKATSRKKRIMFRVDNNADLSQE